MCISSGFVAAASASSRLMIALVHTLGLAGFIQFPQPFMFERMDHAYITRTTTTAVN